MATESRVHGVAARREDETGDYLVTFLDACERPLEVMRVT
jgi:hypothetical protein